MMGSLRRQYLFEPPYGLILVKLYSSRLLTKSRLCSNIAAVTACPEALESSLLAVAAISDREPGEILQWWIFNYLHN
ncbi:hypothetical protein Bca4012_048437 [Brassica carinata]